MSIILFKYLSIFVSVKQDGGWWDSPDLVSAGTTVSWCGHSPPGAPPAPHPGTRGQHQGAGCQTLGTPYYRPAFCTRTNRTTTLHLRYLVFIFVSVTCHPLETIFQATPAGNLFCVFFIYPVSPHIQSPSDSSALWAIKWAFWGEKSGKLFSFQI